MAGLNAGRWDYIFSTIKKFHPHQSFLMPDRSEIGMTVPFMSAYAQLLVKTCHKRGAHAMGGMAAFIPSKDENINKTAFAKVRADKEREAKQGYDGTWVAHPGLVPVALEIFEKQLGTQPHQKDKLRKDVEVNAEDLLNVKDTPGNITLAGVKTNIRVAMLYIAHWLNGQGAVAIENLMEDAATAEISRAQIWQWIHHEKATVEGYPINGENYKGWRAEILDNLLKESHEHSFSTKLISAAQLLDELVFSDQFGEFLTIKAYQLID
jgi:malate synthase